MRQSPGHLDHNRPSEGRLDTYPYHKSGHQRGSGKAPPWKGYRHVRQAQSIVQPKQGKNIYSVALGQCTEATKNHLKEEETYEDINGESDVIRIVLLINSISYS